MGKTAKTNKSARKRFKITGKDKLMRRPVGQNHFNAKDSGNTSRSKRQGKSVNDYGSISSMKKVIIK